MSEGCWAAGTPRTALGVASEGCFPGFCSTGLEPAWGCPQARGHLAVGLLLVGGCSCSMNPAGYGGWHPVLRNSEGGSAGATPRGKSPFSLSCLQGEIGEPSGFHSHMMNATQGISSKA